MKHYKLVILIDVEDKATAENLRDEIVGAIEDNNESREIDAEAMVGELVAVRFGVRD